jgi:gliding motility-associated-like protein
MMSKQYRIICFTLFLMLSSLSILRGTHIVGGEITYKFVSRNGTSLKYHFTMKLYRDIFPKTQQMATPFDAPAYIGIYLKNANGTYTHYGDNGNRTRINAIIGPDTRVNAPTFDCLTAPTDLGVNEGIYEWDATLQESPTSYIVCYQRCCRNDRATNVPNSGDIGSTYAVEITPEAQKLDNNSPVFKSFPPILLCAGEPINFNHAAFDADGDQLVYKFCSPLQGGNKSNLVRPSPPQSIPPYSNVPFNQPEYTPEKPMAGNPVVAIDPNTGLITGVPNVLGNFVVSVCVEEYRNGKLIGKISRDFQFNIVSCKRTVVTNIGADSSSVTAAIKTFVVRGCDKATVTFQNNSYERSEINNFFWEFNVKGEKVRFSDWSPTITFRDTGVYLGKLVLNPSTPCGDSAFVKVEIGGGPKLEASFSIQYDTCVAGPIGINGSVKPEVKLKNIFWDLGDGAKDTGRLSVIHKYELPGQKKITLRLRDDIGCQRDTSVEFTWQPAPPILVVEPDNFVGCTPATVFFNNRSKPLDSTYNIKWDFGDGKFGSDISPTHIYEKSDTYSVKLFIVSPLGCKKEASFRNWIKVKQSPTADFEYFPKIITNLNPVMSFEDKSSSDVTSWRWFFGAKGYSTRQNPLYTFRDTGIQVLNFIVRNTEGCFDTLSKEINVEPRINFFMPNAFTPNNDTKNDEFKGSGFLFGLKRFKMTIWSRWGEVVFQTDNAEKGWNGFKNNDGAEVQAGVYMYEVQYVTPTNQTIVKRDFMTLIR